MGSRGLFTRYSHNISREVWNKRGFAPFAWANNYIALHMLIAFLCAALLVNFFKVPKVLCMVNRAMDFKEVVQVFLKRKLKILCLCCHLVMDQCLTNYFRIAANY